jgi:predicted nucleic acid-binding protein
VKAAYLDASAAVKLFKYEPETDALVEELAAWPALVSSELLAVEARCTARRLGAGAVLERVETVLAGIDLVRLTPEIRDLAGGIAFQPGLRALDAIHVATAITVAEELGAVFVYDANLRAAAGDQGLSVSAPAS